MNNVVAFYQCNFSHAKNVVFEQYAFNYLVKRNTYTSDYMWFNRPIVAEWKVKFKYLKNIRLKSKDDLLKSE